MNIRVIFFKTRMRSESKLRFLLSTYTKFSYIIDILNLNSWREVKLHRLLSK